MSHDIYAPNTRVRVVKMEDDYMSDAFLLGLNDVRPGLKSKSQKRKDRASDSVKIESKHKRIKTSEQEARVKGLATHISSDNKGFSMLQKMGYKEGMGLGRNGTGVTAPIPLRLKDGKGGLGRERYVEEKAEEKKTWESHRLSDFRQRKQSVFSLRRVEADIRKSQTACEQLDSAKGISSPLVAYFWPAELVCREEEEEEEEEQNDKEGEAEETPSVDLLEQLEALTNYLRTNHFYCTWCGTAYDDTSDLVQHCPGDTAEAHDT